MTREQQAAKAQRLQTALGEGYMVRYDDCESGLTRFFFVGTWYLDVPNDVFNGPINVNDYAAPMELKIRSLYHV